MPTPNERENGRPLGMVRSVLGIDRPRFSASCLFLEAQLWGDCDLGVSQVRQHFGGIGQARVYATPAGDIQHVDKGRVIQTGETAGT